MILLTAFSKHLYFKKLTQKLISGLLVLTISGCSINGSYYLRNFTLHSATVILTLTDSRTKSHENPTFDYSNKIIRVNKNLHKKLEKSITGKYVDDQTLEIIIPSRSTVFFAPSINTTILGIESIQIKSSNGNEIISSNDQ